jgi:hypothetical protein
LNILSVLVAEQKSATGTQVKDEATQSLTKSRYALLYNYFVSWENAREKYTNFDGYKVDQ